MSNSMALLSKCYGSVKGLEVCLCPIIYFSWIAFQFINNSDVVFVLRPPIANYNVLLYDKKIILIITLNPNLFESS